MEASSKLSALVGAANPFGAPPKVSSSFNVEKGKIVRYPVYRSVKKYCGKCVVFVTFDCPSRSSKLILVANCVDDNAGADEFSNGDVVKGVGGCN